MFESLELADADEQDLTDIVCGLTAIGGYCANAGLDDDADRIQSLRKRLIIENPEIAYAIVEGDVVSSGVDPEEFKDGIKEILEENVDVE
jgi:uncharacterized protein YuzB (UPF0349 family)